MIFLLKRFGADDKMFRLYADFLIREVFSQVL